MSFDIGINFRGSSAYVTDGTNETYCLNESYPVTRGGATFGYETLPSGGTINRSTAVDRRLAGISYEPLAGIPTFRLDLPSAGDYQIRAAFGDASFANYEEFQFLDNASVLYSSGVLVTNIGQWIDATGVLRTSSTDWVNNNAARNETFSSTIFRCKINYGGINRNDVGGFSTADSCVISHLRITTTPEAPSFKPYWRPRNNRLIGV